MFYGLALISFLRKSIFLFFLLNFLGQKCSYENDKKILSLGNLIIFLWKKIIILQVETILFYF